ncbi:hypothetical protein COO60DRAFT_1549455 [Scenedesmus sp. NREL 46B-D3]|nr:hypothetical protein COO60DRAFT_1549455 [Scenedesmus sp. NREL 46B-D3]
MACSPCSPGVLASLLGYSAAAIYNDMCPCCWTSEGAMMISILREPHLIGFQGVRWGTTVRVVQLCCLMRPMALMLGLGWVT